MNTTLWIELRGFYSRVMGSSEPAGGVPLLIVRDKRVLDACEVARSRGVEQGMTATEAKTLVPEARSERYREEDYFQARNAWLDVCSEYCDAIEPIEPHQAAMDFSGHPQPVDVAARLKNDLHRRLGWRCRMGLGPSKWVARLASEEAQDPPLRVQDAGTFLARFPTASLLPVKGEHRQRLGFLGYRTIGEVVRAPDHALKSQFGPEASVIREAAEGRLGDPVRACYPPDSLADRATFEQPVDDLETIRATTFLLADRIGRQLVARDLQGSDCLLLVEMESGLAMVAQRRFVRPLQSPVSLRLGLRLMLDGLVFEEAVASIRVRLPNLSQSSRTQGALQVGLSARERERSAENAFRIVRAAYGEVSVQRASEMPEPRRKKVLRCWRDAIGWQ